MNYLELACRLTAAGEAFVVATVVAYEPPASARPGAKALIRADGSLEGWVGGSCAQPIIVKEALEALREGKPRLVRLSPTGPSHGHHRPGVSEHRMTCHSGGTLEIFVEPVLPAPQLWIIGQSPLTRALAALGKPLGYEVFVAAPDTAAADVPGADEVVPAFRADLIRPGSPAFVVVATMGTADEDVLEAPLRSAAPYVALVASPKRAAAVCRYLAERGVGPEELQKLRAPAGLDIGAVRHEDIAISILAEIVQIRSRGLPAVRPPETSLSPAEARDPVCGMDVVIAGARFVAEYAGASYYFCCARCKSTFEAEPARFTAASA